MTAPDTTVDEDARRRLAATVTDLANQLQHAVRVEYSAALARDELARDPVHADAPRTAREDLDRRLAELAEEVETAQVARTNLLARAAAARVAADRNAAAARAHDQVRHWTAVEDNLAPDGVPGEVLAKGLSPVNDLLREHAEETGWPLVELAEDMTLRADGWPLSLQSTSYQWRADAMLAVTLAELSELRFVVLDGFDMLDRADRGVTASWLSALLAAGRLDTALMLGTTERPMTAPDGVRTFWLGDTAPPPTG